MIIKIYKHFNLKKHIQDLKKLINLKLDPQNIELKEPIKNIGSFKVKMHIHPMLESLILPIKIFFFFKK